MKVLFVIDGGVFSGAEIVLDRYLQNTDLVEPYFISIYSDKDVTKRLCETHGEERVFALNRKYLPYKLNRLIPLLEWKSIQAQVNQIISQVSPDVLYMNNTTEAIVFSYGLSFGMPTLAHIHDMKSSFKDPVRKYFSKSSLLKYDQLITVSNATKQDWGFDEICEVVYNGVQFKASDKIDLSNLSEIGFIGQLNSRKGVDFLINAADRILADNGDIKFNFVFNSIQDANLYSQLTDLAEKFPQHIVVQQNLSREEVFAFLNRIDLLVVPSRFDPLPTVVLEALSVGTEVIGSEIGGIPEMLPKECLFDANAEALHAKILEFKSYSIPRRQELLSQGMDGLKAKFTEEEKVKGVNRILKKMI